MPQPTDLPGTERGRLMYRARRSGDPDAKATLAELAKSRQHTSDAVDLAAHNEHNPLTNPI